jgi:hypothetical protein
VAGDGRHGSHSTGGRDEYARLVRENAALRRRAVDVEGALFLVREERKSVGYAPGVLESGTDPATWIYDPVDNVLKLPE